MDLRTIEPTSSANEAVLFANTSSFLFRRLRDDGWVRKLAETASPNSLAEGFRALAGSKDVKDVVRGYMCIVALAMKGAEAATLFRSLPLKWLEWGPELASLGRAGAVPTSILTSDARKPLEKNHATINVSNALIMPPDFKARVAT